MNNNEKPKGFLEAYNAVPHGQIKEFKENVMDLCDWKSNVTFYSRVRGETILSKPEKAIIITELKKYDLEHLLTA